MIEQFLYDRVYSCNGDILYFIYDILHSSNQVKVQTGKTLKAFGYINIKDNPDHFYHLYYSNIGKKVEKKDRQR